MFHILADMDAAERRELGHQLGDLIQMIQYNGYPVPLRYFYYDFILKLHLLPFQDWVPTTFLPSNNFYHHW